MVHEGRSRAASLREDSDGKLLCLLVAGNQDARSEIFYRFTSAANVRS
jgi:hypothetical protein